MSDKYCTQCGQGLDGPGKELFDTELMSKSGILRLRECVNCGPADRYIEADGTLILLDLVLGSSPAYRHVLLNGAYGRLILKMALLAVICDGYIGWTTQNAKGEFFEQEFRFYGYCAKALMGLVAFVGIALPGMALMNGGGGSKAKAGMAGLLMAYGSRFLNLSALFWANEKKEGEDLMLLLGASSLMWAVIYLLFFIATVRAMQVTQGRSLPSSLVLSLLAHLGFLATANFDAMVNPMQCIEEEG